MREPCIYILASKAYGTLYIGVTSDLVAPGDLRTKWMLKQVQHDEMGEE